MPQEKRKAMLDESDFKNDMNLYGRLIPLSTKDNKKENDSINIQISLRTNEMMDLDIAYFLGNENAIDEETKNKYLPYFFEFFSVCKKNSYEDFYKGKIGKWVSVKLIGKTKNNNTKNNKSNKEYNSLKNLPPKSLYGTVLFSASPVIISHKYLIFNDGELSQDEENKIKKFKSIPNIIKKQFKEQIEQNKFLEEFKNIVNDISKLKIDIYNVGQGNCIKLTINQKQSILFDTGLTIHEKPDNDDYIQENLDKFKDINPNAIIYSHWDVDHILGIAYLSFCLTNKDIIWIVPDIYNTKRRVSQSAISLLTYLLKNNRKVYLVKQPLKEILKLQDGKFKIFQGDYKQGNFTKANNLGLIIQLCLKNSNSEEVNILLPGDCEYDHMPNECKNKKYTYMLASHHAAEQKLPDNLSAVPNDNSSNPNKSLCICSVGYNTYGHPNKKIIRQLKELGFGIEYTQDFEEGNIIFENGKFIYDYVPRNNKSV